MKSKIAKKILAETPKEIREAVKLYGDVIVDAYNRGYKEGFKQGSIKTNVVRPASPLCECGEPLCNEGLDWDANIKPIPIAEYIITGTIKKIERGGSAKGRFGR